MITVLICDDQAVVREGLRAILKTAGDIDVVGVAQNGAEAVELVARLKPAVVLMDLKMPGVNGVQATRRIHAEQPDVRVLVLTTYDADDWVFDAIRAGASGYLLKDSPSESLLSAIRGTAAGQAHLDPAVAGKVLARVAATLPAPDAGIARDLSERELDILRLIARGLTNADIASRLFLSEGTVRNYVSQVLAKLGVADRTQAAVIALRHGLVELGDL
ncbi:MAG: response regulator transcription factor [Anaerolineales bacterium]|nr:response regulator transcription factor [Anaerolineales bacterium]